MKDQISTLNGNPDCGLAYGMRHATSPLLSIEEGMIANETLSNQTLEAATKAASRPGRTTHNRTRI